MTGNDHNSREYPGNKERREGREKKESGDGMSDTCGYHGRPWNSPREKGSINNSTRRRHDAHTGVLAPILRRRAIVPLDERRRNRTRAIRRLAGRRRQRVARGHRRSAVRGSDTRYVRQIGIAPDPARKVVQRPLHRLPERLLRMLLLHRLEVRGGRQRRRRVNG